MNQPFLTHSAARAGKIARLPETLRTALNRRLLDGEPGPELLDWLNALPEVQAVLAAQFDARPINEQNLSAWRQGGFAAWAEHEDLGARLLAISEQETAHSSQGIDLATLDDQVNTLALLGLERFFQRAAQAEPSPENDAHLFRGLRELAHLQRAQVGRERHRLERERLDIEKAKVEEAQAEKAERRAQWAFAKKTLSPDEDENGLLTARSQPSQFRQVVADLEKHFNDYVTAVDERGREYDQEWNQREDECAAEWEQREEEFEAALAAAQSSQIKVNQASGEPAEATAESPTSATGSTDTEPAPTVADQGESSQIKADQAGETR